MGQFVGRSKELDELHRVDQQKKAALIVSIGRRRIGKSRLIQEFAKSFTHSIEIQGIAPRESQTNQDQLDHFSRELARQTKLPVVGFKDWEDAFLMLSSYAQGKHILVFLDEISWMGHKDAEFAGKLKNAWDLHFKRNDKLRLVLCGSVSSWIQENILNSTGFVGRISLELPVRELALHEMNQFFGKRARQVSDLEKLRVLSLTGGVPRYLEEINYALPAEENWKSLCFKSTGFLFNEFEHIFKDIFERRCGTYHQIVLSMKEGKKTLSEISKISDMPANGVLTRYLADLELSGFVRKETSWDLVLGKETTSVYRIADSYLRFYLKWIAPNRAKIGKGLFEKVAIEKLSGFDSFIGLQFESLVLNHLNEVLEALKINPQSIENAGTYIQNKTQRREGCQIDLLIQTKSTLYLCELKARKVIDASVILEVKQKIKRLKRSKALTVRPILIYAGQLSAEIEDQDFFSQVISLRDLLG